MMWIAIGLAVLIGLGVLLELVARIALIRMIGDGYDDN
ncbi:putative membrane protein [Neisseria musculi]|uniref:Membrane protein n=1 Tax=Neisseria musculi TaxID=1815583 RepID=A0A7H1MF38_9NEIS|nr:putative membrane protein [Neisseria musculi]